MTDFAILNDSLILAQSSENQLRDLLVAMVAIGIGITIFYAVLTGKGRCYELGSVQMLERNLGRYNARIVLGCVGGVCLLLGAYLVVTATTVDRKAVKSTWFSESNDQIAPISVP